MKPLIETNTKDSGTAVLLLWLMSIPALFTAGAGKATAWFGGSGMQPTLQLFKVNKPVAAIWTDTSCFPEFTGRSLFITGLPTCIAAATLADNITAATYLQGSKKFSGAIPPMSAFLCY